MECPTIYVVFPRGARNRNRHVIVSKYFGEKGSDDWYWSRSTKFSEFDTMEEALMMLDMSNVKFPVFVFENNLYVTSDEEFMAGSWNLVPSVIMNKTLYRYYRKIDNGVKFDFYHLSRH